jgi:hypothetical protein
MSNAEDERKLAAIEHAMTLADPAFARRLAAGPYARRARRRRLAAFVFLVLSVLLLSTSALTGSAELGVPAVFVFLLALSVYVRCRRRRLS